MFDRFRGKSTFLSKKSVDIFKNYEFKILPRVRITFLSKEKKPFWYLCKSKTFYVWHFLVKMKFVFTMSMTACMYVADDRKTIRVVLC